MTLNWLLLGGMAVCSCGAFTCAVLYARRRFHGVSDTDRQEN